MPYAGFHIYRLLNGVFLALNCMILNKYFCVTAKGCTCLMLVFTYIDFLMVFSLL